MTPRPQPRVFRAVVTPFGGEPVEVEYPADSKQPTADAIRAAAAKLGVYGFARDPEVRHFRDEEPPRGNG